MIHFAVHTVDNVYSVKEKYTWGSDLCNLLKKRVPGCLTRDGKIDAFNSFDDKCADTHKLGTTF